MLMINAKRAMLQRTALHVFRSYYLGSIIGFVQFVPPSIKVSVNAGTYQVYTARREPLE